MINPLSTTQRLRATIAQLAAIAPRLLFVRTDVWQEQDEELKGTVLLERGMRRQRVNLPRGIPPRPHAGICNAMASFLGITPVEAGEVYKALRILAQHNPRGSWCVRPEQPREHVASGPLAKGFIEELCSTLAECLPGVARIEADVCSVPNPAGKVTRRVTLRIHDLGGEEVAALDASLLPPHLHSLIMEDHKDLQREANRIRVGVWAEQMGAELVDMPVVLSDLHTLFYKIGLNRLDIREGVWG